jgi:hypothetical protein
MMAGGADGQVEQLRGLQGASGRAVVEELRPLSLAGLPAGDRELQMHHRFDGGAALERAYEQVACEAEGRPLYARALGPLPFIHPCTFKHGRAFHWLTIEEKAFLTNECVLAKNTCA